MEVTEGMIPTISRRAFVASLASGGVLWALTGEAQQAGKVYRVGVIFHEPLRSRYSDPLRDGLRQFGYVEGHNLKLEINSANGRPERYASLTADLMNRNVDVFVTVGTPATLGIGQSTRSI